MFFANFLSHMILGDSTYQPSQAKRWSNKYLSKVNVGDLLEVYTNGAYPATRHRVVIPEEEVVRRQPRQSFVLFLQPDAERVAKPIKGCMGHSYMMSA